MHERHLNAFEVRIGAKRLTQRPAAFASDFRLLEGDLQGLTGGLTKLLSTGVLKVLVGTRALLGEGWDAPPINSLVLASFVGSFMLTNQMRSRAIRIDRSQPEKAASL